MIHRSQTEAWRVYRRVVEPPPLHARRSATSRPTQASAANTWPGRDATQLEPSREPRLALVFRPETADLGRWFRATPSRPRPCGRSAFDWVKLESGAEASNLHCTAAPGRRVETHATHATPEQHRTEVRAPPKRTRALPHRSGSAPSRLRPPRRSCAWTPRPRAPRGVRRSGPGQRCRPSVLPGGEPPRWRTRVTSPK